MRHVRTILPILECEHRLRRMSQMRPTWHNSVDPLQCLEKPNRKARISGIIAMTLASNVSTGLFLCGRCASTSLREWVCEPYKPFFPMLDCEHRLRRRQHKYDSCCICNMCPGDSNLPIEDFDKLNNAGGCKSSRNWVIDHCQRCDGTWCAKGRTCCQPCTTSMGNRNKQLLRRHVWEQKMQLQKSLRLLKQPFGNNYVIIWRYWRTSMSKMSAMLRIEDARAQISVAAETTFRQHLHNQFEILAGPHEQTCWRCNRNATNLAWATLHAT